MLNPRVLPGPPKPALGDGRPGVICVLLLAIEPPADIGPRDVSSRAFAGTLMVVLARSRPADLGMSTASENNANLGR
jgi:hypothetical protein